MTLKGIRADFNLHKVDVWDFGLTSKGVSAGFNLYKMACAGFILTLSSVRIDSKGCLLYRDPVHSKP